MTQVNNWLLTWNPILVAAGRIVVILVLALAVMWLTVGIGRRMLARLERSRPDAAWLAHMKTLAQLARSLLSILVLSVTVLMVLRELGIDILPLLAGAGVAGLALSLGAQSLIRDYIGGVLVLVEDIFKVGDQIKVGEISGRVERMTLRSVTLRDEDGRVHTVPNGEARLVTNLSRGWSRALVELSLAVDDSLPALLAALGKTMESAAQDPELKGLLLETPQVSAWVGQKGDQVQASSPVRVQLTAKTIPGGREKVEMALRRLARGALQPGA